MVWFKVLSQHLRRGIVVTHENLLGGGGSQSVDWDLNVGLPKYKAGMWTSQPQHGSENKSDSSHPGPPPKLQISIECVS
jgi:hypothetical protein